MKKVGILLIMALTITALYHSPAKADRFEYRSDVNRWIYGEDIDSIGIRDTIFINQHIQIEDLNVFCGIGHWGMFVPRVLIMVTSPQFSTVWLHNLTPDTFFQQFVWYDTQREEDGPGQLEDYNGSDAFGAWELYCFDPFVRRDSNYWYYWMVEVIGTPVEGVAENQGLLPRSFEFSNIYPNPFNSTALLQYALPEEADVIFDIYNIEGRLIRRIPCGKLPPGHHSLIWDGLTNDENQAASGLYMVRMRAGDYQFTRKAVMLK
jgi:hypothetical protein